MADDKPFDPTPTWIAKAKREGNVARSQELVSLSAYALGTLAIASLLPLYAGIDGAWVERAAADGEIHGEAIAPLGGIVVAVFAIAAVGGIAAALAQERPFFIFPTLKAARLNPAEGLRRMFSRDAAVAALRGFAAFALAALALYPTAREFFSRGAGFASIGFFAALVESAAIRIVISVVAVGAAFAVFDLLLAKRRWHRKLRMSQNELKRDSRESEGDPLLRSRRRMQHRMLNVGALSSVKNAAFVVTNPTHIAMAIEYRPPRVAVPRVLVRAADEAAQRVREAAVAYRVPIIENVALARELYALTVPGDFIPVETYVAVAAIVNELMHQGALA